MQAKAPAPDVRELVERLDEMVSLAEQVDGWSSFPREPIEKANAILAKYGD